MANDFWKGVGNVLTLGASGRNEATNDSVAAQIAAGEKAKEYMQESLGYIKEQNFPLTVMGREQLEVLKRGVETGRFAMDESTFDDYNMYVAPEYEPGGRFESEPRENLVTPEMYQYKQQNPTFEAGSDVPQFNAVQPGAAPEARQINDQFQTGQYSGGNVPKFYNAAEAPEAQYFNPNKQQYQGKEFSLADDPVYQKRLADSGKAIEASAAAKGMQLSGANLTALQENAGNLAAEEGDAAFNRFQRQDQTDYSRFQDTQSQGNEASKYENEDRYRRYLDEVGIRGVEADRKIQQFNIDRGFDAGQNTEQFSREQISKQLGRQLNDDEWARYTNERNFNQDTALNNYSATTAGQGQQFNQDLAGYGTNTNQFNTDRAYDAGQNQQNIDNNLTAYGINNQNFSDDRNFDYGVDQNFNTDLFNAFNYNTQNRQNENLNNYGMLTDSYNRQDADKQSRYGMIGDLANAGTAAMQRNADATTGYYGGLTDISMQQANARAAGNASKSDSNNLLGWFGL